MSSSRPQNEMTYFVKLPSAQAFTEVIFKEIYQNSSMKFYQILFQNYHDAEAFLMWAATLKIQFPFKTAFKKMKPTQSQFSTIVPEVIYKALLSKVQELINDLNNNIKQGVTKSGKSFGSSIKAFGAKIQQKMSSYFANDTSDEDADIEDVSDSDDESDGEALANFSETLARERRRAQQHNRPSDTASIVHQIFAHHPVSLRNKTSIRSENEKLAIALSESQAEYDRQLEKIKQLSIEEAIQRGGHNDEFKRNHRGEIVFPPRRSTLSSTSQSTESDTASSERMDTPSPLKYSKN